ncbi:MAG: hypothetical protein SFV15_15995 [Polyangiaceae bacterium]|nr:hypothetical protein [Polyangiaceae bacterium]
MPPQFWIWALVVLSAVLLIYWWFAQRALVQMRAQVMGKQRAVASVLGPKLVPFGEKMEGWARELATNSSPAFVGDAWDYEEVARSPGVYLRVRLENAREAVSLRKAAVRSLHDGFTACFFRNSRAYDPTVGPPCVTSSACQPHFLCNEYNVCVEPPRPYNMRLAYRALRVLSPQWTDELHLADSELAITAYERDLESVIQHDVPIAVDIWTQARYATIVLDEAPAEGLPALAPGDPETPEEQLQRVPHFARVGVWRVKDGAPLLRIRGWAGGSLVSAAGSAEVSAASAAAQARQANSCSLALQVRASAKPNPAQPAPSKE